MFAALVEPLYWSACLLLTIGYVALLQSVRRVWQAIPVWEVPASFSPTRRISVIVAARNEEVHIEDCVRSVLEGDYPDHLREVIVVDDYSEDSTAARVAQLAARFPGRVHLLQLGGLHPSPPPGKKSALRQGIARAKGELIATLDADCRAPKRWLMLLASAYEVHRSKAVVAPVVLKTRGRFWEHFQALDLLGTMAITGAAVARRWFAVGNGANLLYPKSTFEAVQGFAGNEHRASGDDMYLLAKLPIAALFFLKNADAAVQTFPCPDIAAFAQQRLRWGAKNAHLPHRLMQGMLALMLAHSLTVVVNLFAALTHPIFGAVALLQIAAKAWPDWTLLKETSTFFHQKRALQHFWPALLAHMLYLSIAGLAALFIRRYTWKGRYCR